MVVFLDRVKLRPVERDHPDVEAGRPRRRGVRPALAHPAYVIHRRGIQPGRGQGLAGQWQVRRRPAGGDAQSVLRPLDFPGRQRNAEAVIAVALADREQVAALAAGDTGHDLRAIRPERDRHPVARVLRRPCPAQRPTALDEIPSRPSTFMKRSCPSGEVWWTGRAAWRPPGDGGCPRKSSCSFGA